MKFAGYLDEALIPEWKKAFIDYRGLKKKIGDIRKAREGSLVSVESDIQSLNGLDAARPSQVVVHASEGIQTNESGPSDLETYDSKILRRPLDLPSARQTSATYPVGSSGRSLLRRLKSSGTPGGTGDNERPSLFAASLPLGKLLPLLSPLEIAFFNFLDAQLVKVESFYLDRETEMCQRLETLKVQLTELKEHREVYQDFLRRKAHWPQAFSNIPMTVGGTSGAPFGVTDSIFAHRHSTGRRKRVVEETMEETSIDQLPDPDPHSHSLDPEMYLQAKKRLKKAVLELYRGLEALSNYRILNLTGFRKAIKKFEKVTKIPAQASYLKEKIEPAAISSGSNVTKMLRELEDLFAVRFEQGDMKKARSRLRGGPNVKSHHFSTFRTGLILGLAIPALVSGVVQSYHQQTRDAIRGWDALLYIYGILFVPVFFSLTVGFNLLAWARARINYVFIFDLEVRTKLDPREYFEIPSILLGTLCYAFWLSFSRLGTSHVAPTTWPLVWLVFATALLADPLPVAHRTSRRWFLKNVGKLLISGTRNVEFTDFWLGDQFCSLAFPLSNIYLLGCVYMHKFEDSWQQTCGASQHWEAPYILAALPLLVRLVQSLRRYYDSRLVSHLLNGGKYGSGMISYLLYYIWRHQGSKRGMVFALWILATAVYAIYACSWDFLMDWSVLKSHSVHPFLRNELAYPGQVPAYYFAIVSNLVLRFAWILYIPIGGPSTPTRGFVLGMLEIFRRWQWNFFRLENEHIGNVDQYRITREVPLPYSFDEAQNDSEQDDEVEGRKSLLDWIWVRVGGK